MQKIFLRIMHGGLRSCLIKDSKEAIELRENVEVKGETCSPLSGAMIHGQP